MFRQLASSAFRSFGGVKTYSTEAAGGQVLVHMGGVFAGGALFSFFLLVIIFFPQIIHSQNTVSQRVTIPNFIMMIKSKKTIFAARAHCFSITARGRCVRHSPHLHTHIARITTFYSLLQVFKKNTSSLASMCI